MSKLQLQLPTSELKEVAVQSFEEIEKEPAGSF